eukprot:Skav200710  [mRNA]  locus=scaffold2650:66786:67412:- [translate_table: standard]
MIAANAVTFGAWKVLGSGSSWARSVMLGHFLCSRWHLQKGRWHTLLTSCVFHQRFSHWLNTCALWTSGRVAAEDLTNMELASLFTVCGLSSAGGHVLLHRQPLLGASGALMGVLTTSSMLQPERRFALLPLPSTFCSFSLADLAHLSIGSNLIGFALRRHPPFHQVAWVAHIAGAGAGYGLGWLGYFIGDARFADPLAVHKHTMAGLA